jgi:hypothetical protein
VTKMASPVTDSATMTPHSRESDLPSRARIVASILGPVAWLSFTLLYVGFWAQGFTLFQSVIVIIVSAIILAGVMGSIWASWGMRRRSWSWD